MATERTRTQGWEVVSYNRDDRTLVLADGDGIQTLTCMTDTLFDALDRRQERTEQ